jgi:DNA polymerase-3 subunit beta
VKIKVLRDDLLTPLQLIANVVERRQTLPILSNVKLIVSESGLEMVGTDLEVELQANSRVSAESLGQVTLPAKKLNDIWRSLSASENIVLELVNDKVMIRCGGGKYSLATIGISEFPESMDASDTETIEVNSVDFKKSVEQVAFSMAQQDVRYFLNGMLLEVDGGVMRLVATDGHRLAKTEMKLGEAAVTDHAAIIPRKGVLELLKIVEEVERFDLSISDKVMTVSAGIYRFTTKLVEGQFPDYNKVIPTGGSIELIIDRACFRESLQRASILSNEKYRGIRLLLSSGSLKVQANNPEQEEAEELLEVVYDGEPVEIGFNVGYILDVLSVLTCDEVRITLSDGNSSALLEGVDDSSGLYVVMPMRL